MSRNIVKKITTSIKMAIRCVILQNTPTILIKSFMLVHMFLVSGLTVLIARIKVVECLREVSIRLD